MIGFTAPWALLGLAAAAIPVLLHLFARRDPPTIVFPATRYLAETARAHQRRWTLQHWLLLLVRTLLIAALVLAAAGPTLPSGGMASHAPTAVTVVLDNSLSSAATAGGTPVFERLQVAALAIFGAARSDDALWLLTADGLPVRGSREELIAAVRHAEPVPRRLDLGAAVSLGRQAMAAANLPAIVAVLSDLQATAVTAVQGSGPIVAAVPEEPPVPNLGLAALGTGRQPWGTEGGRVSAAVTGTAGRKGALSIRVGNRGPRQQIAEAGSVVETLSGALPAGWWSVRGALEADELRLDDARQTVVRVAPPVRASWRSEDRFLATACEVLLQNGRLAQGNELTIGALGSGASIVQPTADRAGMGALNRALAARGIRWRYGDPAPGSAVTDSGPLLGRQQVMRRQILLPPAGAGVPATGVLVTAGGAPWAVRDRGVVLLGSRLEPDWTALPLSAEFLPFLDFLANRAVRGELAILEAAPGDAVRLPDQVTGLAQAGRIRSLEGGAIFRPADPGVSFLVTGRDTVGALVVNADPRESALERTGAEALRRLWPGVRLTTPARAAAATFAAGGRADLRGVLLVIAALLAFTDALLAAAGARVARARPA